MLNNKNAHYVHKNIKFFILKLCAHFSFPTCLLRNPISLSSLILSPQQI